MPAPVTVPARSAARTACGLSRASATRFSDNVPKCASRVRRLRTGNPSGARLPAALASATYETCTGSTGVLRRAAASRSESSNSSGASFRPRCHSTDLWAEIPTYNLVPTWSPAFVESLLNYLKSAR